MDLTHFFDNAQLAVLRHLQESHLRETARLQQELEDLRKERDSLGQSMQNVLTAMEGSFLDFDECPECGCWVAEVLCAFPCRRCDYSVCGSCWDRLKLDDEAAKSPEKCPACGEPYG